MNLHDLRKLHDALECVLRGSVSALIDMSPEESEQRLQGFDFIIAGFGVKRVKPATPLLDQIKETLRKQQQERDDF